MGTEISRIEAGKIALRQKDATLENVLTAVAQNKDAPLPEKVRSTELSDAVQWGIKDLPDVFNSVEHVDRILTEEEKEDIYDEAKVLQAVTGDLNTRLKNDIPEIIRTHIDHYAREHGMSGPCDKNGHTVLGKPGEPFKVMEGVSQSYVTPKASINENRLHELMKVGEITEEQYLALTEPVEARVFDEEKALRSLKDDPSLLEVLSKITDMSPPGQMIRIK